MWSHIVTHFCGASRRSCMVRRLDGQGDAIRFKASGYSWRSAHSIFLHWQRAHTPPYSTSFEIPQLLAGNNPHGAAISRQMCSQCDSKRMSRNRSCRRKHRLLESAQQKNLPDRLCNRETSLVGPCTRCACRATPHGRIVAAQRSSVRIAFSASVSGRARGPQFGDEDVGRSWKLRT